VQTALEVAKNSLDEITFGGMNCGNGEIGFTMIRPGHVGLVNGAVPESNNVWAWKHDCVKIVNAFGFENWIHNPTAATTTFSVNEASHITIVSVSDPMSLALACEHLLLRRSLSLSDHQLTTSHHSVSITSDNSTTTILSRHVIRSIVGVEHKKLHHLLYTILIPSFP